MLEEIKVELSGVFLNTGEMAKVVARPLLGNRSFIKLHTVTLEGMWLTWMSCIAPPVAPWEVGEKLPEVVRYPWCCVSRNAKDSNFTWGKSVHVHKVARPGATNQT